MDYALELSTVAIQMEIWTMAVGIERSSLAVVVNTAHMFRQSGPSGGDEVVGSPQRGTAVRPPCVEVGPR